MPFERIILEEDPDFDVQKEYQDELDYYYQTHPNDKGYVAPKTFKESASGFLGSARNAMDSLVKLRDEAYGYNQPEGKPRLALKPVEDMKFLPDYGHGDGGYFRYGNS